MIETRELTRQYGPLTAVDRLSFSVNAGEVLGFLGPNGAGKTTTMRMIAGFVRPTSGSVSVGGHSLESEPLEAKRLIGYLPEGAPSYSYGSQGSSGFGLTRFFPAFLFNSRMATNRARIDFTLAAHSSSRELQV